MSPADYESDVEEFALTQLAALGYECLHGDDIAPDEPASERASFGDVILRGRLEEALRRLNPEARKRRSPRRCARCSSPTRRRYSRTTVRSTSCSAMASRSRSQGRASGLARR